jgi:hypothetical protein
MTPRRPTGVRWGGGDFNRESSLLPIGHLGVIYDSKPIGYALFFIAIQISVKLLIMYPPEVW